MKCEVGHSSIQNLQPSAFILQPLYKSTVYRSGYVELNYEFCYNSSHSKYYQWYMNVQAGHFQDCSYQVSTRRQQQQPIEPMFYYFAYGSCMCPVDLKRSLGEKTHVYAIGPAKLKGYRLGFYSYSPLRNCGVLDVIPDENASVEGVLYQLPWRLSYALDEREGVHQNWYRHEIVNIHSHSRAYNNVRTYVVVNKLTEELPPNDWYFNVVLRGAVTCGLSEQYCWKLFNHMHQLQQRGWEQTRRSA